jgi:hypothetical protein
MKSPEGLKITVSQTFVGWNPEKITIQTFPLAIFYSFNP